MIRVTVELVPHGDEKCARILCRGVIANDGSGTLLRGNYRFSLSQQGRPTVPSREGEVKDFPRLSKNVWHLLHRVLNAAFP